MIGDINMNDKVKVKFVVLATREVEVLKDCYPEGADITDIINIEMENANSDIFMTLDNEATVWDIKVDAEYL